MIRKNEPEVLWLGQQKQLRCVAAAFVFARKSREKNRIRKCFGSVTKKVETDFFF